jgi:ABC-2 type transport system ATP-binding protein
VIVTTDDPFAPERLAAVAQVESITRAGSAIAVRGRGADLVTQVIGCIAEHRMHVSDFRTEVCTLEDVFLRLTGHTIRD